MTLQETGAFTKNASGAVFTQRHHQEAHVIEPVGRLVGELGDEELQDGSQVALAAHRRHLHRSGHGRVTVTATGTQRERERERESHVIESGTLSHCLIHHSHRRTPTVNSGVEKTNDTAELIRHQSLDKEFKLLGRLKSGKFKGFAI